MPLVRHVLSLACAFLLPLYIFFACSTLYAKDFYFHPLQDSKDNKLSSVRSLFNDHHGYLWLGGDAGVYRFDGYTAVKVNGNPTRGLYLDKKGRFWSAGTTTLAALEERTYQSRFYPNLANKPQKPDYEIISDILHTHNDRLLFATGDGISEYLYELDKFIHYPLVFEGTLLAATKLWQNEYGQFFVGTNKGLFKLPLQQLNAKDPGQVLISDPVIANTKITAIADNDKTSVLVGSNSGFYLLDLSDFSYELFRHDEQNNRGLTSDHVTALLSDNNGYIWIGTGNGLTIFDPEQRQFQRFYHQKDNRLSISNNLITDLHQDAQGNILIATYSGIDRFNHHDIQLQNLAPQTHQGKSINNVWSLLEDSQGHLWQGTFGSGLYLSNGDSGHHYMLDGDTDNTLVSNRIPALMQDAQNRIWIGTTKGLQWLDKNSGQFTTFKVLDPVYGDHSKETVFDIEKSQDGDIWLALSNAIAQLNPHTGETTIYNKNTPVKVYYKQWVRSVLPLGHQVLAGSDLGLSVLDLKKSSSRHYDDVGSVVKIYQDSQQNIWVLAMQGLSLFDRQEQTVKPLGQRYGKNKNDTGCNGMVEDGMQQLWLVCNNGLKVLDIKSKTFVATFTKNEGVDLSGFLTGAQSMIKSRNGKIFLAQRDGTSGFYARLQNNRPKSDRLAITQLNITANESYNQPFNFVDISKAGLLGGDSRKIEFQFSNLDMARARSAQYQYRLIGYDEQWSHSDADNRRAIYTNLSHGDYRFEVKNKDGDTVSHYSFSISPKPWQTWWAKLGYLLLLIAAIYLLIYYRTRTLSQRSQMLEQNINERTEELLHSKQAVEQLMNEREKLVENIHHQTRTPIQIMLGNIHALQANELSVDDYAKKQTQKVEALVNLTDQILDVSKMASIDPPPLQPLNLSELIKPLILGLADVATNKGLRFDTSIDDNLPMLGSKDSLIHAIDNIVGNSIKYTDQGSIHLSATQQQGKIIIQCTDTGIGIPEQDQTRVFQRYQRAENADDRAGAGIGLAMVKTVILAHNGNIELCSEVGVGTSVTISLPIYVVQTAPEQAQYQKLQSAKPATTSKDATILLVEDNLELINYMTKLLSEHYQVISATCGEYGLTRARQDVPDIIISDLMMSQMDGYELTRQIRQDEITSHIPLLLVTAKNDEAAKEQGFAVGANDFINKPFKSEDLLNRINNQLRQIAAIQAKCQLTTQQPTQFVTEAQSDRLLNRYLAFIAKHYHDCDIKIKDICQQLHISVRQLERKVKHLMDMTPNEVLNDYRLTQAKALILSGKKPGEVFALCGFSSHAYFSKRYKEKFGRLPSEDKSAVVTEET